VNSPLATTRSSTGREKRSPRRAGEDCPCAMKDERTGRRFRVGVAMRRTGGEQMYRPIYRPRNVRHTEDALETRARTLENRTKPPSEEHRDPRKRRQRKRKDGEAQGRESSKREGAGGERARRIINTRLVHGGMNHVAVSSPEDKQPNAISVLSGKSDVSLKSMRLLAAAESMLCLMREHRRDSIYIEFLFEFILSQSRVSGLSSSPDSSRHVVDFSKLSLQPRLCGPDIRKVY
jgi:hypothetical protein